MKKYKKSLHFFFSHLVESLHGLLASLLGRLPPPGEAVAKVVDVLLDAGPVGRHVARKVAQIILNRALTARLASSRVLLPKQLLRRDRARSGKVAEPLAVHLRLRIIVAAHLSRRNRLGIPVLLARLVRLRHICCGRPRSRGRRRRRCCRCRYCCRRCSTWRHKCEPAVHNNVGAASVTAAAVAVAHIRPNPRDRLGLGVVLVGSKPVEQPCVAIRRRQTQTLVGLAARHASCLAVGVLVLDHQCRSCARVDINRHNRHQCAPVGCNVARDNHVAIPIRTQIEQHMTALGQKIDRTRISAFIRHPNNSTHWRESSIGKRSVCTGI
eukprot:comp22015_c0_seq2/m.50614 comp22015_c0_seq2/g.50614  ORF comp22015_c0_seq2/g.50614 comp22015_c0_seq2/m.50614 type:complete len:325 (-) comp22015_c0_seq2:1403-2377(-)